MYHQLILPRSSSELSGPLRELVCPQTVGEFLRTYQVPVQCPNSSRGTCVPAGQFPVLKYGSSTSLRCPLKQLLALHVNKVELQRDNLKFRFFHPVILRLSEQGNRERNMPKLWLTNACRNSSDYRMSRYLNHRLELMTFMMTLRQQELMYHLLPRLTTYHIRTIPDFGPLVQTIDDVIN